MFSKGIVMTRHASNPSGQEGFALVYMAALLAVLLIFTGLAVDTGRAYVVKAQLTKAVDGAALAAARNLNSGAPKAEATRIFQANFPTTLHGHLVGHGSGDGPKLLLAHDRYRERREHGHRDRVRRFCRRPSCSSRTSRR